MKEPIATITNAAYVIAGALIIQNLGPDPFVVYVGACTISLGIASALYHATLEVWAQASDEIAMYFVFVGLAGLGLLNLTGFFLAPVLTLGVSVLFGLCYRKVDSFIALPVIGAVVLVEVALLASITFAAYVAGVFLLAFLCRQVAEHQKVEGILEQHDFGHGIFWHTLTAVGIYLIAWALA